MDNVIDELTFQVVKCLEESLRILNYEPTESSEGIMATAAKDALLRIKDWEKIIGKIWLNRIKDNAMWSQIHAIEENNIFMQNKI